MSRANSASGSEKMNTIRHKRKEKNKEIILWNFFAGRKLMSSDGHHISEVSPCRSLSSLRECRCSLQCWLTYCSDTR